MNVHISVSKGAVAALGILCATGAVCYGAHLKYTEKERLERVRFEEELNQKYFEGKASELSS